MNNDKVLNIEDKSDGALLSKFQNGFKNFLVPKASLIFNTPFSVSLLTWLTAFWSFFIVLSFYLGKTEEFYLWLIVPLVFLQHTTDTLDGAVGRETKTGLIKWGYYADHFFDFIFISSIVFGYGIITDFSLWLFVIYASICGSIISIFLSVSANNTFKLNFLRIGPDEIKLSFMVFHSFLVYMGIYNIEKFLPYIAVISILILFGIFWSEQRTLWKIDIKNKEKK